MEIMENKELCLKCAQKSKVEGDKICCEQLPGLGSPEDFQTNGKGLEDNLYNALVSGRWTIDSWNTYNTKTEESVMDYYIRPATKGNEGRLYDPSWGGPCTFLGVKGCELEYLDRPENCRLLKPVEPGGTKNCKLLGLWNHKKGSKRHGADLWLPYKKMIERIRARIGEEKGQNNSSIITVRLTMGKMECIDNGTVNR